MAFQARVDNNTEPLILDGYSYVREADIAQDEQRTTDLLHNTIMAKNATTRQWVPFNDLTQTSGESVPRGIYVGDDIAAADLAAGDIEDIPIMVGGCCTLNDQLVVFDDDTLDANSIVNPANIEARTVREALMESSGMYLEETINITEYEN
ncbi:MAG: hypothetical protein PVG39_02700 [Desulfobacteraceae bacterium]|jgi:hypothetical protein